MIWNPKQWKRQFEQLTAQHYSKQKEEARFLLRSMRVEVFKHTTFLVQQGYYTNGKNQKIDLTDVQGMVLNTKFYHSPCSVHHIPIINGETIVKVENIDCLLASEKLLKEGYHPAVLNMASRRNPGGGVQTGAGAQEENLFRRSNLFQSLYQFAPFADKYGLRSSKYQYLWIEILEESILPMLSSFEERNKTVILCWTNLTGCLSFPLPESIVRPWNHLNG